MMELSCSLAPRLPVRASHLIVQTPYLPPSVGSLPAALMPCQVSTPLVPSKCFHLVNEATGGIFFLTGFPA